MLHPLPKNNSLHTQISYVVKTSIKKSVHVKENLISNIIKIYFYRQWFSISSSLWSDFLIFLKTIQFFYLLNSVTNEMLLFISRRITLKANDLSKYNGIIQEQF